MGKRSQFFIFLSIQCCSILLCFVLLQFFVWPVWASILLASFVSVLLSWRLHDGPWWRWMHALFLPLALGMQTLELDPIWYLLAFVLTWLVFGHVGRSRVPLYLSNRQALLQLDKQLPLDAKFLDIGAGTGTVLAYLARHRADVKLTGVELAWLPWFIGYCRKPKTARWHRQDFSKIDFSEFNVIYAFLSPEPMSDLWLKVRQEMPAGSLFISNTFTVPEVEPDRVVELNDWKNGKLLIWRI